MIKKLGIEYKQWITTNPCDICVACGAVGVVPMDYDFPHQGLDPKRPPAHPNCRCALAPAISPDGLKTPVEPMEEPQPFDPFTTPPRQYKAQNRAEFMEQFPEDIQRERLQWWRSLPDDEQSAINQWKGTMYSDIREMQRTGRLKDPLVQSYESAITKPPQYDGTVWRGLNDLSDDAIRQLAEADTIVLDAHTSFSAIETTGFDFTFPRSPDIFDSVIFEVRNSSGHLISKVTHEAEVILTRQTELRVLSREVIEYTAVEGSRRPDYPYRVLRLVCERIQ